jgi:hypothetical protein
MLLVFYLILFGRVVPDTSRATAVTSTTCTRSVLP